MIYVGHWSRISGALDAVRPVLPWPHHFFAKKKRKKKPTFTIQSEQNICVRCLLRSQWIVYYLFSFFWPHHFLYPCYAPAEYLQSFNQSFKNNHTVLADQVFSSHTTMSLHKDTSSAVIKPTCNWPGT